MTGSSVFCTVSVSFGFSDSAALALGVASSVPMLSVGFVVDLTVGSTAVVSLGNTVAADVSSGIFVGISVAVSVIVTTDGDSIGISGFSGVFAVGTVNNAMAAITPAAIGLIFPFNNPLILSCHGSIGIMRTAATKNNNELKLGKNTSAKRIAKTDSTQGNIFLSLDFDVLLGKYRIQSTIQPIPNKPKVKR